MNSNSAVSNKSFWVRKLWWRHILYGLYLVFLRPFSWCKLQQRVLHLKNLTCIDQITNNYGNVLTGQKPSRLVQLMMITATVLMDRINQVLPPVPMATFIVKTRVIYQLISSLGQSTMVFVMKTVVMAQ
ncbi:unnamed protein product [Absidia cylindrospora]